MCSRSWFGHAGAGVLDCEGDAAAVLRERVGESDALFGVGEPHGVAQQFGERLAQQQARRAYPGRLALLVRGEMDFRGQRGVFRQRLDTPLAAGVYLDHGARRRRFGRFDVGDVEHVVDEFLQVAAVFADDVDVGTALGFVVRGCRGQFGESHDGVQRGVDFVGDVADKDAFHAAALLGGPFGPRQPAVQAGQDDDECRRQHQDHDQSDFEQPGAAQPFGLRLLPGLDLLAVEPLDIEQCGEFVQHLLVVGLVFLPGQRRLLRKVFGGGLVAAHFVEDRGAARQHRDVEIVRRTEAVLGYLEICQLPVDDFQRLLVVVRAPVNRQFDLLDLVLGDIPAAFFPGFRAPAFRRCRNRPAWRRGWPG